MTHQWTAKKLDAETVALTEWAYQAHQQAKRTQRVQRFIVAHLAQEALKEQVTP